jgi:hypothetical protein
MVRLVEWLSEQAVVSASCIWEAQDGEPWLLSFDFAEVDGRLECVGLQMRSYLKRERSDQFGPYASYLSGQVGREDLIPKRPQMPELDMTDADSRAAYVKASEDMEVPPVHPVMGDPDAVVALLRGPIQEWSPRRSPRPLRTATLRGLPLGDVLARVRREIAAEWRSGAVAPKAAVELVDVDPELLSHIDPTANEHVAVDREREELERRTWEVLSAVKRNGGWDDDLIRQRDELSRLFAELDQRSPRVEPRRPPRPIAPPVKIDATEFVRLTQQAAGSFHSPGQKAGRPLTYSPAQLELVAKTYREAFESGSPQPTKDVAVKLGLTRARAAKLVMRCRQPEVGLLGPTEHRKAGGTRFPTHAEPDGPEPDRP